MNKNVEDRNNISRYLGSEADQLLASIKGEGYRAYRQRFDDARLRKIRPETPIEVAVGLTSYCNLLCRMCYRNYIPDPGRFHMPLDLVQKLSDQCRELQVDSIWLGSFTEALLHPQIREVLQIFGQAGAQDLWFTTNGTLLTTDIAQAMIDNGVTKLHISLDAATPETYKIIRGGNLEVVERNIHNFLALREKKGSRLPLLRLTFCEQDANRHEIDRFVEKWSGVADIIDVQKMTDYSTLLSDDFDEKSYEHTFFDCYYPIYQIAVTYDGRLWPCPSAVFDTPEPRYLQTTSLLEYWNSEEMTSLASSLQSHSHYGRNCLRCLSLKKQTEET